VVARHPDPTRPSSTRPADAGRDYALNSRAEARARRFRFAPTPSRPLHAGSALAALFGWSVARIQRGTFILRIEDIDRARCRPEHEASLLTDLTWLGLDWDEGPDLGGPHAPYRQSERLDRYDGLLETLAGRGHTYCCLCSRADLKNHQSAPHLGLAQSPAELPYPGTCRLAAHPGLEPQRGGIRLALDRLDRAPVFPWDDRIAGQCSEDLRQTCGDFLLGRPGQPTYQLAVVADDFDMDITDVVRGRDLLHSTARQLALQAAIGAPTPTYWHHPLLLDSQGQKLSKRDEAPTLESFRSAGLTPGRLIGGLGRALGLWKSPSTATADDFANALAAVDLGALRDGHASEVFE
jgi:glutamyl-tRNA synthetase